MKWGSHMRHISRWLDADGTVIWRILHANLTHMRTLFVMIWLSTDYVLQNRVYGLKFQPPASAIAFSPYLSSYWRRFALARKANKPLVKRLQACFLPLLLMHNAQCIMHHWLSYCVITSPSPLALPSLREGLGVGFRELGCVFFYIALMNATTASRSAFGRW